MLAIRVKQKDGTFYLVNYKAPDVLRRIRFLNRYYQELGGDVDVEARPGEEDIVNFIMGVEREDKAFQRGIIRRKVKEIINFYENAQSQPMIPGPILLYTPETLKFNAIGNYQTMGDLSEPTEPFTIIDGQHRLAGLRIFQQRRPEEAEGIEVPTIIFDGKQEDFAAEMFVIINSTQTKISKSHLVDLMEKVTYGVTVEKKWAAWIVTRLYEDGRSPLQYKINKLGGRSKQEKWILQSELYNEIYRLVDPRRDKPSIKEDDDSVSIHRFIATDFSWDRRGPAADMFIDYFKAVQETMKDVWGSKSHMFTTSVTLKALVRAFGDILTYPAARKTWRQKKAPEAFMPFLEGWKDMALEFRKEGFYERFAAKGQIERVHKIHTELARRL